MASIKNFLKDCKASAAVMFAVTVPVLLIAAGAAIDGVRMYTVYSKAQNALDAAMLGAATTASSTPFVAEATRIFNANYQADYMSASVVSLNIQQTASGVFDGSVTIDVPMTIMHIAGLSEYTLNLKSQVLRGFEFTPGRKLELAIAVDSSRANSYIVYQGGSSVKTLLDTLYNGASTLSNLYVSIIPFDAAVNLGVGRDNWVQAPFLPNYQTGNGYDSRTQSTDPYPVYITQHGFSGTPHDDARFEGAMPPSVPGGYYYAGGAPNTFSAPSYSNCGLPLCSSNSLQGCSYLFCSVPTSGLVANRDMDVQPSNNIYELTDNPPDGSEESKFRTPRGMFYDKRYKFFQNITVNHSNPLNVGWYFYYNYAWSDVGGHTLSPLLFAAQNKQDIITNVDKLSYGGTFRPNIGLMWAWYTLSPKWQNFWDGGRPQLPLVNDSKNQKVIILMTRFDNTPISNLAMTYRGDDHVANYGVGYPKYPLLINNDNVSAMALCEKIKAAGITIYTINFYPTPSDGIYAGACASKPEYAFKADNAPQITNVIKNIEDQLLYNTIRLSK